MKVYVTRAIPDVAIDMIEKAGITVNIWKEKRNLSFEELVKNCKESDALLSAGAGNLNKEFLNECRHLKVISLYSVGYDRVDIAEATRLGIPVGNTPDVLSAATADVAFLLMLAVSRKAFYHHKRISRGDWGFSDPMADLGTELKGKTLGIWGLGKIGSEMARRCVGAYNMKVIYCNRHNQLDAEKEFNATKVSFDELLQQSDVLSVHTALTAETKGKFDLAAFQKMRSSAIFINTARGAIHNEEDLFTALRERMIWGAGLDVTNPEPMLPDNPLLEMSNVAVLPHIGSATKEAREGMAIIAAKNLIAGVLGEPLPHVVNPEVYEQKPE
jgi:lactate dehydrogenase-like 2-hydroxyacid dehydrogenase